jgi:hypothetical protein
VQGVSDIDRQKSRYSKRQKEDSTRTRTIGTIRHKEGKNPANECYQHLTAVRTDTKLGHQDAGHGLIP